MPPETPSRTRAMPKSCLAIGLTEALRLRHGVSDTRSRLDQTVTRLLRVVVRQHPLGDLLHRHREVVLRAGFHERRRIVIEGAFAELVVVVVDLPGPLRGHDHERVARINVLEQVIDAGIDHGRDMVPAGASRPRTSSVSSWTARSRSSFSTT